MAGMVDTILLQEIMYAFQFFEGYWLSHLSVFNEHGMLNQYRF
jgi:hypothetical protein